MDRILPFLPFLTIAGGQQNMKITQEVVRALIIAAITGAVSGFVAFKQLEARVSESEKHESATITQIQQDMREVRGLLIAHVQTQRGN